MDNCIIIIDNSNHKKMLEYFLKLILNSNYTWSNGETYISNIFSSNIPKLILIDIKNRYIYYDNLTNYNNNYTNLFNEYNVKHVYHIENKKEILECISKYNIKNFDFTIYNKILYNIDTDKNIIDILYGKKKKVNETIKKFNEF